MQLSRVLERLWILDEERNEHLLFEEAESERTFLENCTRNASGQFVVRLPLKIPRDQLG